MEKRKMKHQNLNVRINDELNEKLDKFRSDMGMTKTGVVECAIREYIEKYENASKQVRKLQTK